MISPKYILFIVIIPFFFGKARGSEVLHWVFLLSKRFSPNRLPRGREKIKKSGLASKARQTAERTQQPDQ
jgi:hypothetical protein